MGLATRKRISNFEAAGTGKTFLTSKVIDDNKIFLTKDHNQGLAFFYFNRNDSSRDSALSCLRSLVRQLLTPHGHQGHIPRALRDLCNEYRRQTKTFTWNDLCQQLANLLNLYERTTVLIDALDECILERDRRNLIEMLSGLMAGTNRRLLVFVSGRPEVDIQKAIGDRAVVKIRVEDNQRDIAKFVQEKMEEHCRWDKFTEATQVEVVRTLLEKSQGMSVTLPSQCSSSFVVSDNDNVLRFRLTALQVDELLQELFEEDVLARLGRLPKNLTAAYDDIYSRQISNHGGVRSAITERALIWVLAARTPVSSSLLLSAVRIDVSCYNDQLINIRDTNPAVSSTKNTPDGFKHINGEVDEDLLQELCTNLLILDSSINRWSFAHTSVAEYLEEHYFSSIHAHAYLGFACLLLTIDLSKSVSAKRPVGAVECLRLTAAQDLNPQLVDDSWLAAGQDLDPQPDEPREGHRRYPKIRQPLLTYAVKWWPGHVARVAQELEGSTGKEIDHRQGNAAGSHTSTKTDGLKLLVESFFDDSADGNAAYRFWCNWNTTSLYQNWEGYGFISKSWSRNLWTRMRYLVDSLRHKDKVSTVVALGLYNFLPGWWEKLKVPSSSRLTVGIPISGSYHGNYLHAASFFGPAELVSALLDAGMDINERTSDGRLPLTLAQTGDCEGAFRVLFERGRYDPNSLTGLDNPLFQAVNHKNVDMVRYLLCRGADPNQRCTRLEDEHGWALQQAATHDNITLLRILVEEGRAVPDLNIAICAAYYLKLDALKYLILNAGIAPNARVAPEGRVKYDGSETIMMAAAHKIHEWEDVVIFCLQECGVDFKVQLIDDPYLTKLFGLIETDRCHREGGDMAMGMWLPQANCGSLLESVASSGTLTAVRFVVEAWEQDVNAVSGVGDYGSPLIAAAFSARTDVVQYLLNKGAEVNCQVPGGNYHSALVAALSVDKMPGYDESRISTLRLLLGHGADVNLRLEYGDHGSALSFVAAECFLEEWKLEFLIRNEADVNMVLRRGRFASALVAAAALGPHAPKGLKLLLDAGADPNLPLECGHYGSPLIAAAAEALGDTDIVQYLLDRGAGVNYTTTCGEFTTALMAAASGGHKNIFRCLVGNGADLTRLENREAEALLAVRSQQVLQFYPARDTEHNGNVAGVVATQPPISNPTSEVGRDLSIQNWVTGILPSYYGIYR